MEPSSWQRCQLFKLYQMPYLIPSPSVINISDPETFNVLRVVFAIGGQGMSRKKYLALVLLLFFVISGAVYAISRLDGWGFLNPIRHHNVKVRIGSPASRAYSIFQLALVLGLFDKNGVDVELTQYTTGTPAMENLLAGNLDLIGLSQTPVMMQGFTRKDFKVLAHFSVFTNPFQIIARKDAGVQIAQDLRGKKINVAKDTTFEFFLHLFLGKIGINPQKDVKIVFLPDKDFLELLPEGKVDAVVAYDPFAGELKRKMGDNVVVFSDRGLYTTYGLLVVRDDLLQTNPKVVDGVLRSLTEAVLFYEQNRSESIRLLARHRGKSLEWLQQEMSGFSWSVELNQSLLLALESEARWRVSLGRSPASQIPNYLDIIDEKPLKKVRPFGVSIIR